MKKVNQLFKILLFVNILFFADNNYAQSENVSLVGRWAEGFCIAVTIIVQTFCSLVLESDILIDAHGSLWHLYIS